MGWQDDYYSLKNAGFSDAEIAAEGQKQRDELTQAGFSQKEIDEHFGVKEPDMAPVKALIEQNLAKTPKTSESFLDALESGFELSSSHAVMQALRGRSVNPEVVLSEDAPTFHRIASQAATIAGDIPAMVAGAVIGTPAGAAAGGTLGSAVPILGNIAGVAGGAAIGAGAGANALPTAIRESLVQYYEKGEMKDFNDFWERTSSIFIDTLKSGVIGGATVGVGGKVLASASKIAAPATARIASAASEVATMVTVGKAFEGEVPKAQDFMDAALLVGGLHLATGTAGKLREIYTKTGQRPWEVIEEAKTNPVVKQELLVSAENMPKLYEEMAGISRDPRQLSLFDLKNDTAPANAKIPEPLVGEKPFKVSWLKEPLTDSQFQYISSYYNETPRNAEIRWFDELSGKGTVRIQDGPLAGQTVSVHGSAFGGDYNFGQGTSFKPEKGLPVSVKLLIDDGYIQVESMIQRAAENESLPKRLIDTAENAVDGESSAQDKILSRIGERKERVSKGYSFDDFYRDFVDRLDPVKKAVEEMGGEALTADSNPYALSRMANDSKAKVLHFFGDPKDPSQGGVLDFRTLEKTGKSFQQIIEPHRNDLNGLKAFLISKRALELEKRNIKSGFDLEAAREVVTQGEKKFGKAASELVDFQNGILKYLKDSGAISEETFGKLVEAGKSYISFKRISEQGDVSSGSRSNPIKKIKGSDLEIRDPFISMIENADLYLKIAETNRAKVALVELAEKSEGQELIKKAENQLRPVTVSEAEVSKFLKDIGVEADSQVLTIFRKADRPLAENEFEVYRNGKREIFETAEPSLAQAINTLEGNSTAQNFVMKIAKGITTVKRLGISLTPDFILRNWVRDQLTAGTFTKGGTIPFWDTVVAMGAILHKNEHYYNWLKAGGANGAFLELSDQYINRNIYRLNTESAGFIQATWNLIQKPIHYLEAAGALAEQATRLAEAKKVLISTGNIFESGMASRESTIDFQRMGAKISAWNAITAFQNAQIQGLDRSIRALRENPKEMALRAGMYITAPSLLLWWANKDDERYKEIPRWQKDLFWIFPTDRWVPEEAPGEAAQLQQTAPYLVREGKNGRYEINKGVVFRLPKPQELGLLFGSLPERVMEAFFTENPDAMKDFGKTVMELIEPGILPDAVTPVAEQWANKSLFTDRKIVPFHLEGVLPQYQYTDYTTDSARALSKFIIAVPFLGEAGPANSPLGSPMVLENYVRGWTGNSGIYALQLADKFLQKAGLAKEEIKPASSLADIPFIKAFVVRYPSAGAQSLQDFEQYYERNSKVINTMKSLSQQGDVQEYEHFALAQENAEKLLNLDGMREAIRNQNKMIQMIYRNPEIAPNEKRQLIDGLYFGMIETGKMGVKLVREMESSLKQFRKDEK